MLYLTAFKTVIDIFVVDMRLLANTHAATPDVLDLSDRGILKNDFFPFQ